MNRIVRFNPIIVKSARKRLGKVKPGKRTKAYMSTALRSKIRPRNQLLSDFKQEAWIKVCTEVNKAGKRCLRMLWETKMSTNFGNLFSHR